MPTDPPAAPVDSTYEKSVFLNVPYDRPYARLLPALIASLVALGRIPRCALEIHGGARLDQIYDLIASCRSSINDLSRVTLSGPFRVPRFNMPFELGIAFSLAKTAGHRIYLFEAKERLLQSSLSDMNGYDAEVHGSSPAMVIYSLVDWFVTPDGAPAPGRLQSVARRLSKVAKEAQRERNRDDPFKAAIFRRLVAAATVLAREEGLLAP